MSEPILYGTAGSPYVRSVRAALEEKKIPHRFEAFPGPQMKEQPHLSRNPFGKVPAFEHDGLRFFETQAILRYVDDAFGGIVLQPPHHKTRARMNQVMGMHDTYLFPQIAPIIFHRIRAPRLGAPVDEAAVASALPFARKGIAILDEIVTCGPFLVSDSLSLADIIVAPFLDCFLQTQEGQDIMAPHIRLRTWSDRVAERESMKKTRTPA